MFWKTRNQVTVVDLNRLTNIEVETIKKIFAQIGALRSKLGLDYKSG